MRLVRMMIMALCLLGVFGAPAQAATAPTPSCNPGYALSDMGNCEVIIAPANAYVKQNEWLCRAGFQRDGNQCIAVTLPANAEIWGNGWRCKAGYRDNRANQCVTIQVPPNGYIKGNQWVCHIGYHRVDDRCERLVLPQNAIANDSDFGWKCLPGFFNNGQAGCDRIILPENAYIDGNKWFCNAGYIRYNNACQKQDVPDSAIADEGKTGWRCLPGYRANDDGTCKVVLAPDYAYVKGDEWFCRPGYVRDGDVCARIIIPLNASATSTGWKCNPGYSDNGDGGCDRVIAPVNAYVKEDEWFCQPGFIRDGDLCVTITTPVNATATSTGWRCNPGFYDNGNGACDPVSN